MSCRTCKGRGYLLRYSHRSRRYVPIDCGHCGGSGIEPTVTLRELQQRNQQRIRDERKGNT